METKLLPKEMVDANLDLDVRIYRFGINTIELNAYLGFSGNWAICQNSYKG